MTRPATPAGRRLPLDSGGDAVVARGVRALREGTRRVSPEEPFAAAALHARRLLGDRAVGDSLVAYWAGRAPGHPTGEMRYRWELTHRHAAWPSYGTAPAAWRAWRPSEQELLQRDPFAFEERLTAPIVCSANAELLAERAGEDDSVARTLLDEALPVLRREFARHAQVAHAWADTFALWCLVRQPQAFALLHPIAVALASGSTAQVAIGEGLVRGNRFPFADLPLASASAQLATGLLALGIELPLVARLVEGVASGRDESGGWADGADPPDVLTTLVAADLLLHVDPAFDFAPTATVLSRFQSTDGLWRALGPEATWLTAEVLVLFARARQDFAERFRWPYVPGTNRDRKTGLPFYAHFADLADLFAALGGLAQADTELAFIDLAGFRAFNNRFGQEEGDRVLAHFAAALTGLPSTQAIRDGGDEFLVVGAPTLRGLRERLDEFRLAWPARFRERFGTEIPSVAPRILVVDAKGRALRQAREALGRRIADLKHEAAPDREGLLVDLGRL